MRALRRRMGPQRAAGRALPAHRGGMGTPLQGPCQRARAASAPALAPSRAAVVMSGTDNDCQNPTWPADRFLTEEEIQTKARQCSMMRARSPGERICIIDQVSDEDE